MKMKGQKFMFHRTRSTGQVQFQNSCVSKGIFRDMVEMVRICLQSQEKEFETVYSQLCEMGLDQYDAETVLTNHQYLNTKRDLEDSKSDDSPRKRL